VRRVALVTGAARGIGAATVRALAADGWAVVATDRCAPDPRLPYPMGTREELEALAVPDQVIALPADTRSHAELAAAVEQAEQVFGGLDAVVTAAGAVAGGLPLWEQEPDQLHAVLEINLYGVLVAARTGVPALLRRPAPRSGRFLAISSAAASTGLPMLAGYGAAKAGVSGVVRALSSELRGTGITANAVSPGSTRTMMLTESARLYGLTDVEEFGRHQAIERLLEPEEVAAFVCWLAGPGGAGITGADLPLDGGFTG
jgi:SDR family mycofactocin-dependent oxidoreductase